MKFKDVYEKMVGFVIKLHFPVLFFSKEELKALEVLEKTQKGISFNLTEEEKC